MENPKVLIAGVGNELRQDDAFGIAVVRYLEKEPEGLPQVRLLEVGIGGIHLVQELHAGYQTLILVDAVEWDLEPGALSLREVSEINDVSRLPVHDKRALLADMHYTNPMRALMLAKALGVLPDRVYILGCRSVRHDDFAIGMSPEVEAAVPKAAILLKNWLQPQTKKK